MSTTADPPQLEPIRRPLQLELLRADFRQVVAIDQVNQVFTARIFVQFRVHGGSRYEELSQGIGEAGSLTGAAPFKSVPWYLERLRWANATEAPQVLQRACNKVAGDGAFDIVLEVDGSFLEQLELRDFPFDLQELTVKLQSLCANEGGVPVEFTGLDTAALNVQLGDFVLSNMWELQPTMTVQLRQVKLQEGRTYPMLAFTVRVHRRSTYYLINVALPMALFSLLPLFQFRIPPDDTEGRMSFAMTLVLTAVAYKFVTASMLPAIAYLTLLDEYVFMTSLVLLLAAVESALAAPPAYDWQFDLPRAAFELGGFYCLAGLWASIHTYYALRVWRICCWRADQTRRWMEEEAHFDEAAERARRYSSRLSSAYAGTATKGPPPHVSKQSSRGKSPVASAAIELASTLRAAISGSPRAGGGARGINKFSPGRTRRELQAAAEATTGLVRSATEEAEAEAAAEAATGLVRSSTEGSDWRQVSEMQASFEEVQLEVIRTPGGRMVRWLAQEREGLRGGDDDM